MEIRIQSVKFDADKKLLEVVEKKVSRLERFNSAITSVDVTLSLLADHSNKDVKLIAHVPGSSLVVERTSNTFEAAVTECVDLLKEKIVRNKERHE